MGLGRARRRVFGRQRASSSSLPEEDGGAATVVARRSIRLDPGNGHPKFDSWSAGCHYILGSAAPPGGAWMSDVCFVYRWNGTSLERTSTVSNGVPLGTINGIWAGDDEEAWMAWVKRHVNPEASSRRDSLPGA